MKQLLFLTLLLISSTLFSQEKAPIVTKLEDGRYTLTDAGASYFARLSLECASRNEPHYFNEVLRKKGDKRNSDDVWPSFYGCFDWHSSVHNHWCLIKILKKYPNIPEAKEIRKRLEESFTAENIKKELKYVSSNDNGLFEFPYGQSWLLKVADELYKWDDPDAKRWLENLRPLSNYIAFVHLKVWPIVKEAGISGSHDSPALGLSFAYDYSVSFNDEKLKKVVISASKRYFGKLKNSPIAKEPFDYDFMSATLLVTDLMRKTLPEKKYVKWVKEFCPDLFIKDNVKKALIIKRSAKHDGYESHWDGYHLNRIWCLNGMLKTLPPDMLKDGIKDEWVKSMNDMWDYAQLNIGKKNYDIDHWLSSFSVFALIGYE